MTWHTVEIFFGFYLVRRNDKPHKLYWSLTKALQDFPYITERY